MDSIKIFLKKKKQKVKKGPKIKSKYFRRRKRKKSANVIVDAKKNLSEDQKEQLVEYRRTFCITHSK